MLGCGGDDELSIIFEKVNHPLVSTPPAISQKKAEAIKRDVRSKFFGVTGNEQPKPSTTVSKNVSNAGDKGFRPLLSGHIPTEQKTLGALFPVSRKENSTWPPKQRNIRTDTNVLEERKEAVQSPLRNGNLTCAKVGVKGSINGIKFNDSNAIQSVKQPGLSNSPCKTPLHNPVGSTKSSVTRSSSLVVASPSSSQPSLSPSRSITVNSNKPIGPVSIAKAPQSSNARTPIMPNSTDSTDNIRTGASVSVANSRKLQNGHKLEGLKIGGFATIVADTKVSRASFSSSGQSPDAKKHEVLGDTHNCAPTVASNFSAAGNSDQDVVLLQSNLETVNHFGPPTIPVSPPKPHEHTVRTGKINEGKLVLNGLNVEQSVDPLKTTPSLVPIISVKQERISQPTTVTSNHVQSTQNGIVKNNEKPVTCTGATPPNSSNVPAVSVKLSPQLKAHPRKFLNPSQSPSIKASSVSRRGRWRSPFKKSPLSLSGRRNPRIANNSPASVKKALNFDVPKSDGSGTSDTTPGPSTPTIDAIYCKHFKLMLLEVMNNFLLFSESEMQIILNFINLSSLSKMLYIRMFSRKFCWHRVSDISYESLGGNLTSVVEELDFRDLVTLDYSGEDLRTLLGRLRAPEVKQVCLNLNVPVSATTKEGNIEALLRYGSNQQTLSPNHDYNTVIRKQVAKMLGECFKLCEAPRRLFLRILLVFALPQRRTGPVEVLPQMMMMHEAEVQKIKFPQYPLSANVLFTCRDEVVNFHEADDLCNGLLDAISTKNMKQVMAFSNEAEIRFTLLMEKNEEKAHASNLPLFLRRFTSCSKYAYVLDVAAEALRKAKASHKKAVEILEMLLGQDLFLTHHRGFWYDMLALVLHFHQRDFKKAAGVIIRAMSDEHVTEVQKYNLVIRGHRIHDAKNSGLSKQQKRDLYFSLDDYLEDPPSVVIKAKVLPIQGPGRKRVYVEFDVENQETKYSSVEEYAISYYKKQGYESGYHTEGSIVSSLFALIFWDVLYEQPVPAAFLGNYQVAPLDLNYPDFYASRSVVIDDKLRQMEEMSVEELQAVVTEMHTKHVETVSLVNWDLLPTVTRATVLVACLGTRLLARICERFAKNYRMARSGFPDLLVWSASQQKCKIVEVKGPNDHLSGNQVLWLKYLIAAGADAEVCNVQTTGSKTAKRKSTEIEEI